MSESAAFDPICACCKHWARFDHPDDPDDRGECHRRSPSIVIGMIMKANYPDRPLEAAWPETQTCDWCGEFEAETRDEL